MGIVDYLSREPNGEPWPESELDERFVVTSIESLHKALDCLISRFSETNQNSAINILEYSKTPRETNYCKDNSSRGCYDNQFVQNRTKLDRNENGQSSRFQKDQNQKNTLEKIAREKQSVNNSKFNKNSIRKDNTKISQQSADFTQAAFSKKNGEKQNRKVKEDDKETEWRSEGGRTDRTSDRNHLFPNTYGEERSFVQ